MKVESERCSVMSDSLQPQGYTVHGILLARILELVAVSFSRWSFQPGIEPRSPSLRADSLPAEPPGKSKNTGVGSLSLLQQIFPTQESNWGLLHRSWILYQLSYQGSPELKHGYEKFSKNMLIAGRCHFNKYFWVFTESIQ